MDGTIGTRRMECALMSVLTPSLLGAASNVSINRPRTQIEDRWSNQIGWIAENLKQHFEFKNAKVWEKR